MFLVLLLTTILSGATPAKFTLERGMKRLHPSITAHRSSMIAKVIRTKAHKYGLKKVDYPVIIAMAFTESTFRHIKGAYGEVGILQCIPKDNHIRMIVAKYIRCLPSEKYCRKNGRPDVYGRRGRLLMYKTYRFLQKHPHYALEAGLGEIAFWRKRWKKSLKKKFWTYFPAKHYKRRFKKEYNTVAPKLRRWWSDAKRRGGDLLFVSAYNWGGAMGKYIRARSYPMKVLKHYNIAVGREPRANYTPYNPLTIEVVVENENKRNSDIRTTGENKTHGVSN